MKKLKLKQIALLPTLLFMLSFGLSGCIKGNIAVDIKPNGSGIVSISFGMTQQAKALISSQGTNPLQDIEQSMSDGSGSTPTDVKVTKWMEGDYEWTKAEKEFKNLDEINKVILNRSLFNHFSLTRKRGIFQDEFILDAELDALNTDIPSDDSGIDPSAFIEMSFSTRLPGKITETNGFVDANDPNLVVWNVEGYQTVSVKARSVTWNWLNIFGILVGGFLFVLFVLFGIYALGGFDSILYPQSQNKKPLPQRQQSLQSQNEKPASERQQPLQSQNERTSFIVNLNIEDLLLQINTRALNSAGQFYKKSGEIALVWKDNNGKQRFIDVKELGNNQISINGQACLATKESVKSELINALNKQKA
jgi:hypothetical protein